MKKQTQKKNNGLTINGVPLNEAMIPESEAKVYEVVSGLKDGELIDTIVLVNLAKTSEKSAKRFINKNQEFGFKFKGKMYYGNKETIKRFRDEVEKHQ